MKCHNARNIDYEFNAINLLYDKGNKVIVYFFLFSIYIYDPRPRSNGWGIIFLQFVRMNI